MEEALELARAKDTKERMAGVERLHSVLESSRKTLTSSEVTALVDCCLDLLKDNNFRVSQGALQALDSAAVLSGDHFKLHFNTALVPSVVERLGDAKQPVRDAARRFLLTLMQVSSPTIIVERAGSYAWNHKSWRVREEFARTVTSAIALFASTELPLQRAILPPILQMLCDSNPGVREAAILCIEEMYAQAGPQFRDELQRHNLPSSMVKDINARLERIEPQIRSSDGVTGNFAAGESKPASLNPKKSSPKAKSSSRETSLFGAEGDITEKPVDPIKVYSEKELIREIEKIASTLVPEKDWSVRITAMQRVEALIFGGATDYPCFRGLLKQLVGPLSTQLSDRRSSIVKQACHLLCFLSKELLGDFEGCAEMFIPVLFKLVVITVLVIAESADNCIKTMLRNCKVARVLPRIADCAKNDRNAVLRARCCEYALLILEHWPDAPEIQRSADLYEDLLRCCVADAMSEVRSTARMCYRMFAKTWPDRSRRLFSSFDPVIQRIINEEDGGIHRRHASPSVRDRGALTSFTSQSSAPSNLAGYGTSAIVAMDRSSSLQSGTPLSVGLLSQTKSHSKGTERSLESVLHASKQKVSAIESMLRGLDLSEKHNSSTLRSSSLDLGVDPPSSRDPPFPPAVPASNHLTNSLMAESTASSNTKGDDLVPVVFELPHELFDALVLSLPPLALKNVQTQTPFEDRNYQEFTDDCFRNGRKRGRHWKFNKAWKALYKLRWPDLVEQIEPVDWQQMYWEMHLQNCLDEATEIALLPSFNGCIGDIRIPDAILKYIGVDGQENHLTSDYLKLSYHCQAFGCYARCLRLQHILCTAETCHLLRTGKLKSLVLRLIRSKEHIDGLCKLLNQNSETLTSLEFIHCKLSPNFINAICGSLLIQSMQTHGIQHFSINASSFLEPNLFSLPVGLSSFLSSGRSLCSLKFCDNQLGRNFAKMVFNTILDVSSSISILDLSENNISGWLSDFNKRSSGGPLSSLGIGKSLQSLRVLNLRGNNLRKDDAESLRYALVHMPNLEVLDISDNSIEDEGIRSLIPYFVEATERCSSLADLNLETCDLSCNGVTQLLNTLSTFKGPLKSLSLADNCLGSQVAVALGKFLQTSIEVLNIGGIGLGSTGFQELQEGMTKELKLVKINISKNHGGIETAKFFSKLMSFAPKLGEVNAAYNFMPVESLSIICAALKVAKGNLERLDLTENTLDYQLAQASMLNGIECNGRPVVILPIRSAADATYDDDP